MSPRADSQVSRELVKHYIKRLKITVYKLAREATKFHNYKIRKDIKREGNNTRKEKLEKKLRELVDGQLSPSVDAINRMLRLERTTLSTHNFVLDALQLLTQQAHDDEYNPLTPRILPVPIDLITKLYESPHATDTKTDYPSCFDGIEIKDKRMSLFEAYYDLGQAIRQSDAPKTLYAAIGLGLNLRFLLNGIADIERPAVEKIVIRCLPIEDSDYFAMRMQNIM